MGKVKKTLPVKLFIGITHIPDMDMRETEQKLSALWGEIDLRSECFNFSRFTSYYEAEMGNELKKYWVGFEKLIDPEKLPGIKLSTNKMENEEPAEEGGRKFNLDPGYLTAANIVLATTKNFSHRIYLAEGIYGDLHLIYRDKKYCEMPWTYPDYADKNNLKFFTEMRIKYMSQIKGNI